MTTNTAGMKPLTARQREILALIRDHQLKTGMPPTRAEITAHFGFHSTYAAEKHLKALERKGVIKLLPGTSRGIRLLETKEIPPTGLPMISRVVAGKPILAEEFIEAHYDLDPHLFQPRPDYLLRIHDMSMRDAGILDGDLLAVHRTPRAEHGQIVVARIDGEVTIKRLRITPKQIRLIPENPDFKPIIVSASHTDYRIEGIVVGVIRNEP